jgi:CheY-like chemotaxis protein
LVVDDETDVADLFRQHFRREARNGTYVMHFANSGDEALQLLDAASWAPRAASPSPAT